MTPDKNPTPMPIYGRPPVPVLKWYTVVKRSGCKHLIFFPVLLGVCDLTGESGKHQVVDT